MTDSGSEALDRRDVRALAILVVVAAALRFLRLDSGLWYDEYAALVGPLREPLGRILTTFAGDLQHQLFSILGRASLVIFGESAWSIRLAPALFGIATIPVLYMLARLTSDRRESLLAAALLAVFYHHVWFSQNARGYSIMAFFAITATWVLLRGIRSGRMGFFAAYAALVALGAFTHLTLVFLAVGQALVLGWLVVGRRAEPRLGVAHFAVAFGGGAALTLLLYAPILGQVVGFFLHRESELVGLSTPGWAVGEAVRMLRRALAGGTAIGVVAVGIVFGIGALDYLRRRPLEFWLFSAPVGVTIVGAAMARGTMYPRFFFFLIGFMILILVRGAIRSGAIAARALRRPRWTERLGVAFIAVPILTSLGALAVTYYPYPKQAYADAVAFADSRLAAGDRVVASGDGAWPVHGYFERSYPLLETGDELAAERSHGVPVWIVFSFPRYLEEKEPEIMLAIDEECGETRRFRGTVGDGDVVVCAFPPLRSEQAAR